MPKQTNGAAMVSSILQNSMLFLENFHSASRKIPIFVIVVFSALPTGGECEETSVLSNSEKTVSSSKKREYSLDNNAEISPPSNEASGDFTSESLAPSPIFKLKVPKHFRHKTPSLIQWTVPAGFDPTRKASFYFSKNGVKWSLIKKTRLHKGLFYWKPGKKRITDTGLIRICAKPQKGKKIKPICEIVTDVTVLALSAPAPGDIVGPVINNLQASAVTSNSATIIWTTDENSSSTVDFGPTSKYGSRVGNGSLVTAHGIALTGLTPSSTYHYRVISADAVGNASSSNDFTFTTTAVQQGIMNQWEHRSSATGQLPTPPMSNGQSGFKTVDLDGDGHMDYLMTLWDAPENLLWYRKTGNTYQKFVLDTEKKNLSHSDEFRDIDNDGDLDVLIGDASDANTMNWWENPYPNYSPTTPWIRREIRNSGENFYHDSIWGDFDGDGVDEYISWNQYGRQLLLFEVPANPKAAGLWPVTQIFSWNIGRHNRYRGSDAVDINLDGKVDFVGGCSWFEHTGGTNFVQHVIDEAHGYASVEAGQLIEGGRPEVVCLKELEDAPLNLYEWNGTSWKSRTLMPYVGRGHTLQIGDVNGDGHLDIMVSEMAQWGPVAAPPDHPNAKLFVLYGDGTGQFSPQTVSDGQGYLEGQLADMDNDGDLDLVTPPFHHNIPLLDMWINQGPATGDATAPVISNLQIIPDETTATVNWETNELSSSAAQFGPSTAYGTTIDDGVEVISHTVVLTGLTPNTSYHYRVQSTDHSGNSRQTIDHLFTTLPSGGNPSGLSSDHFTGAFNTARWTFVNPKGDASLSANGKQVIISLPAGSRHDLWTGDMSAPRIRQAVANANFQIEAKFDAKLTAANQMQGLTVEEDDGHLLRVDYVYNGTETRVFAATLDNGVAINHIDQIISSSAPIYLRLNRAANLWTLSYSYNGKDWIATTPFTSNITSQFVGIFTGNTGALLPTHAAVVDYFKISD